MKVLLFGATGMLGQGLLRECLLDGNVELVTTVGRTARGVRHSKLREIVNKDLLHYESIEGDLAGFDACFFCLGVSSSGMTEAEYERVTYGITVAAAETLRRRNPQMTFIYISGAGTDSSEKGRSMWARVKGKTENTLLRLPLASAHMFRPCIVQPLYGTKSKTPADRIFYAIGKPLLTPLRWAFPDYVLTTEQIGRAMWNVARRGYPQRILETKDIRAAAGPGLEKSASIPSAQH